jgi:hypothetical protein
MTAPAMPSMTKPRTTSFLTLEEIRQAAWPDLGDPVRQPREGFGMGDLSMLVFNSVEIVEQGLKIEN